MCITYESLAEHHSETKDLTVELEGAPPPEAPRWLIALIPGALTAIFFAYISTKE